MGATPTVGDSIERLALQRLLDHIYAEKQRGLSAFPLAELAEATGLDPTTAEQAMTRLETDGPYTVNRVEPEYGERCWHVRGSAYDLGGWDSEVWNVRS
jgi:DNA-binding MarR family transcriptional regulator